MRNTRTKQEILASPNILLVYGIPTSGKSILTYNTFVKDSSEVESKYDLMRYTKCDTKLLLGWYNNENSNRNGLDSIERSQVGELGKQIVALNDDSLGIVLEGNRCISRPMIKYLEDNNTKNIVGIWVCCNQDVAYKRTLKAREFSGDRQIKIIKSSYTASSNFSKDLDEMGYEVYCVDTTNCDDFTNKTFYDFDLTRLKEGKQTLW